MRLVALWVSGLLASAIFGALVGSWLNPLDGAFFGFFGGIFAFVCARVWFSERRAKPTG